MTNHKTGTERTAWTGRWYETIAAWQATLRSER